MAGIPLPLLAQRGKGTVTRYPLHIPPTISPASNSLYAAQSTVNLGDGRAALAYAYNGFFPGPTFRAERGTSVGVTLINGLPKESTIHWHGMIVPTAADGHPKDAAMPGASYLYEYSINQRACMNWYHPHPHMLTGEQVCLGLAGAFIINDAEEAALGLPSGAYEVPLILRDANLDKVGNLIYNPRTSGFVGQIALLNGTRDPKLDVDTALYRFRILNGANARLFKLALSNGASFYVIGNDGGLLASRVTLGQIEIGPGERLDLLVDFRELPVGTKLMLEDLNSGWKLLEFNVTRQVAVGGTIPTELSSITPLTNPLRTRFFSFDGMSRINGRIYDMERIDFQVPFGETELWRFSTNGNAPHPVHVHGASFQVQSRSGGRGMVFPWEAGWKDTVLLQDQETVDVLVRFEGFRGLYLMHCHKLEHEDMGMMANFEVV
jgi:blue copper oxidase